MATMDNKRLAGHIARFLRRKEQRGVGDIAYSAETLTIGIDASIEVI